MTITDDITWLTDEANWLKTVDAAFFPSGGQSLLEIAGSLASAAPVLQADWTKADPTDLLDTGPLAATNSIKAIGAAYTALYGGFPSATRLQSDAARFLAIANSLTTSGTVLSGDIDWLTAEQAFLAGIDRVLDSSDPSVGLQAAVNALSSSNMASVAAANSDDAGIVAVNTALTRMNDVFSAVYSRGVSNTPSSDATQLQTTIIPDLQAVVHVLPLPGGPGVGPGLIKPAPTPVVTPGLPAGSPAVTPTSSSTAMSTATFLIGATAFVGVGWLAWHLAKKRRAAVPVSRGRRLNPRKRKGGR